MKHQCGKYKTWVFHARIGAFPDCQETSELTTQLGNSETHVGTFVCNKWTLYLFLTILCVINRWLHYSDLTIAVLIIILAATF